METVRDERDFIDLVAHAIDVEDRRGRLSATDAPRRQLRPSQLRAAARGRAGGADARTRSRRQDIRELHVGLLNMMPDAAFEATERQFMRLVGSCNRIAQIHVHPFAVDAGKRGA